MPESRQRRSRWHWLRFYRHRWFRLWLLMVGISAALVGVLEATGNHAVEPAAFLYGAAAGPLALLVATHDRTGIGRSVPASTLLGTVLFGGAAGLLFAGFFDAELISHLNSPRIVLVGFIEEPAKLLAPVAAALSGRYLTKASGVALGLASATGFAVLESMAYAFGNLRGGVLQAETVVLMRGLTTPFGHLAWTGLVCAVAFGVWERRGRVVITPAIVAAFLVAAVLHSANDTVITRFRGVPAAVHLLYLLVAVVSYVLFHRVTRDLKPAEQTPPSSTARPPEPAGITR